VTYDHHPDDDEPRRRVDDPQLNVRRFKYAEVISAANPTEPFPKPRGLGGPVVVRSRKRKPVEEESE
jgi:hypothetical protein